MSSSSSPSLESLPPEILIRIFDYVELLDYLSLIYSGAVCTYFRRIISTKPSAYNAFFVNNTTNTNDFVNAETSRRLQKENNGLPPRWPDTAAIESWGPVVEKYFGQLPYSMGVRNLDTEKQPEDGRQDFETFRRLPWAASAELRKRFLTPEASWRRIPLVSREDHSSNDKSLIRRVDILRMFTVFGGTSVQYSQADLASAPAHMAGDQSVKALTIGAYYDMLLSDSVLYGGDTTVWYLMPGWRISSFDDIYNATPLYADPDDIEGFFSYDPQSAILVVMGGSGCCDDDEWPDLPEHLWEPRRIGHVHGNFNEKCNHDDEDEGEGVKVKEWQGPLNRGRGRNAVSRW